MADYKEVIKDKKLEAGNLMNDDQLAKCNGIIHTASVASGVAGAVPISIADAIPISAAQITMVIALGKVFGQKIEEAGAKSIIAAAASTFVIKLIPFVGWGVSAVVAAGVTEAIGWTVALDFAKSYRQEYMRQQNAKEAADAYAQASYYKKENKYDGSNEEAEDFSDLDE